MRLDRECSKIGSMSKFAVIKLAGSQYRVAEGDIFEVDKIEAKKGDTFVSNEVLSNGPFLNLQ